MTLLFKIGAAHTYQKKSEVPPPGRDLKKRIMAQDRSIFLTSSFLRSSFITQLNCLFRDRTTVYDVLHKGVKHTGVKYSAYVVTLFCFANVVT